MTLSSGTLTSGTSSGSSRGARSSGSEGDIRLQALMDLKRKRRKESNRESAKRSRLRKQQHLDDMTSQVKQLETEKKQLITTLSMTTQSYAAVEAQNSVLRAQVIELDSRLCALREITIYRRSSANHQLSTSAATAAATTTTRYPSSMSMTATATSTGGYYDHVFSASAWSSSPSGTMHQLMQQPIDLLY
ncbi:hypothetical protein GUJ93_ZPchr0010g8403 [Zizania palustris]|uniref:BZIP domain-containing protein n=1 Tax=Zizania palustris TaxID=103762 RepID=A0A8J5WCW6_ZIZPA|nr:hypothetical protein GUJ93_ZPchr0010g8403 [Zizania palustris]